jgi:hypothetical protein
MSKYDRSRLNKLPLDRYAEYFTNSNKLGSVALLQTLDCSGPDAQP